MFRRYKVSQVSFCFSILYFSPYYFITVIYLKLIYILNIYTYIDRYFSGPCARPRDQGVVRVYGRKLLTVYPCPVKFGSDRYCGSGYIVTLVHHVISQDHVIIWSCDFMGRSQSNKVTIPPSFVL